MLSMEWAYINVKKANKSHYLKACGANKDFRNQDWVNKKNLMIFLIIFYFVKYFEEQILVSLYFTEVMSTYLR